MFCDRRGVGGVNCRPRRDGLPRDRTVRRPRRVGGRFAVHRPDGLELPARARHGKNRGRRDDHVRLSGVRHVPRVGAHAQLDRAVERARGRHVHGQGEREGVAERPRTRHRRLAVAEGRRGGAREGQDHDCAPRPHGLRRAVRRGVSFAGGRRTRDAGCQAGAAASREGRPRGVRRRHRRHLRGDLGGASRIEGCARAGPSDARRRELERGARALGRLHEPRAVSASRRRGGGNWSREGRQRAARRTIRGPAQARRGRGREEHPALPQHADRGNREERRPHRRRDRARRRLRRAHCIRGTAFRRLHGRRLRGRARRRRLPHGTRVEGRDG